MTMPKASEQTRTVFQKLLPPDSAITTRRMFGNLSAFVNGNMFSGVFGDDLFVRVSDEDQAKIRKQGGKPFEPMAGRAMSGYVIVPTGWQKKPDAARAWVLMALAWSKKLPAKGARKGATKLAPKAAAKSAAKKPR
jgi:TfoX/Sxy family transcriptional regulator of competence genes